MPSSHAKPTNRADQRRHHVIYKTTCIVTGKWYIGLHSTDDLADGYRGSGTHLARSVKKHGKEQHRYEILEHLPTRKLASDREKELITVELRSDPMCMNIAGGGIGHAPGHKNSEESKRKNSEASKRMWDQLRQDPEKLAARNAKLAAPEHVAKRARANTGKKRSAEQLANLEAGQQRYYSTVDPEVLKARAAKGAVKNSKTWTIESEDGSTRQVSNLKKLSQELGIRGTLLYKTIHNGRYVGGIRVLPVPK